MIFYKLQPDFITKYQAYELAKAREAGQTAEAFARKKGRVREDGIIAGARASLYSGSIDVRRDLARSAE